MQPPDSRKPEDPGHVEQERRWPRALAFAVWLASVLFVAQFAVASNQELEPQASALGWILVAILLLAGLAVWGTDLISRQE